MNPDIRDLHERATAASPGMMVVESDVVVWLVEEIDALRLRVCGIDEWIERARDLDTPLPDDAPFRATAERGRSLGDRSMFDAVLNSPKRVTVDTAHATRVREMHDLIRRAIANAHRGRDKAVRWSHVAETFAIGSTRATKLCRTYGLDPDEQVGTERNPTCGSCGNIGGPGCAECREDGAHDDWIPLVLPKIDNGGWRYEDGRCFHETGYVIEWNMAHSWLIRRHQRGFIRELPAVLTEAHRHGFTVRSDVAALMDYADEMIQKEGAKP